MQGKRNPRALDPLVDSSKNPNFLLLISENFVEARTALSRPGGINQNPVKVDIAPVASAPGPAQASIPSGSNYYFILTYDCYLLYELFMELY